MTPLLLLAGLTLLPVELGSEVLDVRVADIDADGKEEILCVTEREFFVLAPDGTTRVRRPAAPLTVVGKGLIGVVRKGRYHAVSDPFGAWTEGPPQAASLLAAHGVSKPRLLDSPGDLDGDGRADPVLTSMRGMHTPAGLVPLEPEARMEIKRNEDFAIEFQLPVPVAGNWSGRRRELVFLHKKTVLSYSGLDETDRLVLPLQTHGKGSDAIQLNHVFLRDLDADGRLDLVVVVARGAEGLFGAVEAMANIWLGGRIYDKRRNGFHKRAAFLKVDGALMSPSLVDVDGDKDLDLVLPTVTAGLLSGATGQAPATHNVFRFTDGSYERKPAWTYTGPVPMTSFTAKPVPPVTFLRDLDQSRKATAIETRGKVVRLLRQGGNGFVELASAGFAAKGRPSCGARIAALRGEKGVLIVR
ncbi:MAG: FG-GAP repeat domain-containing protein [Planctomycetota bacterium]|jgi:hypothetical protein